MVATAISSCDSIFFYCITCAIFSYHTILGISINYYRTSACTVNLIKCPSVHSISIIASISIARSRSNCVSSVSSRNNKCAIYIVYTYATITFDIKSVSLSCTIISNKAYPCTVVASSTITNRYTSSIVVGINSTLQFSKANTAIYCNSGTISNTNHQISICIKCYIHTCISGISIAIKYLVATAISSCDSIFFYCITCAIFSYHTILGISINYYRTSACTVNLIKCPSVHSISIIASISIARSRSNRVSSIGSRNNKCATHRIQIYVASFFKLYFKTFTTIILGELEFVVRNTHACYVGVCIVILYRIFLTIDSNIFKRCYSFPVFPVISTNNRTSL